MRNAGLDEAQAGIKIAARNINNVRYADDTTLMAKSEELLDPSSHRTRKDQFSFQSQRKAMPKNAQTTTQVHLSHMLVKKSSKFSK